MSYTDGMRGWLQARLNALVDLLFGIAVLRLLAIVLALKVISGDPFRATAIALSVGLLAALVSIAYKKNPHNLHNMQVDKFLAVG